MISVNRKEILPGLNVLSRIAKPSRISGAFEHVHLMCKGNNLFLFADNSEVSLKIKLACDGQDDFFTAVQCNRLRNIVAAATSEKISFSYSNNRFLIKEDDNEYTIPSADPYVSASDIDTKIKNPTSFRVGTYELMRALLSAKAATRDEAQTNEFHSIDAMSVVFLQKKENMFRVFGFTSERLAIVRIPISVDIDFSGVSIPAANIQFLVKMLGNAHGVKEIICSSNKHSISFFDDAENFNITFTTAVVNAPDIDSVFIPEPEARFIVSKEDFMAGIDKIANSMASYKSYCIIDVTLSDALYMQCIDANFNAKIKLIPIEKNGECRCSFTLNTLEKICQVYSWHNGNLEICLANPNMLRPTIVAYAQGIEESRYSAVGVLSR